MIHTNIALIPARLESLGIEPPNPLTAAVMANETWGLKDPSEDRREAYAALVAATSADEWRAAEARLAEVSALSYTRESQRYQGDLATAMFDRLAAGLGKSLDDIYPALIERFGVQADLFADAFDRIPRPSDGTIDALTMTTDETAALSAANATASEMNQIFSVWDFVRTTAGGNRIENHFRISAVGEFETMDDLMNASEQHQFYSVNGVYKTLYPYLAVLANAAHIRLALPDEADAQIDRLVEEREHAAA